MLPIEALKGGIVPGFREQLEAHGRLALPLGPAGERGRGQWLRGGGGGGLGN